MKLIITLIYGLLLSSISLANDVPEYMKDGTITVTLKDGKSYTFSTNEYMVVKRGSKKENEPEPSQKTFVAQRQTKNQPEEKKYRVTLLAGYGYTGKLKDTTTKSTIDVVNDKGFIGGLAGQLDLNKNYHLMGEVLTNQTFLLGVGKNF